MTRYSVHSRDEIFAKSCIFLSFAKNTGKGIRKNFLTIPNNLLQMHLKLSQKKNFKT